MSCSSFRLRIMFSIMLLYGVLTPAFSQDSASAYHKEILKNRIYVAPLHFFDAITPSIQVGYERSLNRDYGLQLEAGLVTKRSFWGYLMVDILGNPPDYYSTFSGYKIRGELKRYLHIDRVPTNQAYISAELTFLSSSSSVYDFFVVSDPDSMVLKNFPVIMCTPTKIFLK
ncbi:MAG: hypothetical protein ACOYXB_12245 [Bacteroidota bacterium]